MNKRLIATLSVFVMISSLVLTTPAHAQWVKGEFTVISTMGGKTGDGDAGLLGDANTDPREIGVYAKYLKPPDNRYQTSSSFSMTRVFEQFYTWQGSLPNSGNFDVLVGGNLKGEATVTPNGQVAYAFATTSGLVKIPDVDPNLSFQGNKSVGGRGDSQTYDSIFVSNYSIQADPNVAGASVRYSVKSYAGGQVGVAAYLDRAAYYAETTSTCLLGDPI